jgi:hypothetical protein
MNYQKIYNNIVQRAQNRKLNEYIERHHIIPKCIGGSNDIENIVELTAKEHFICHKLLTEIYPAETGLHYASWIMATMKDTMGRKYKVGANEYQRLRENLVVSDETKLKMKNSHIGYQHPEYVLKKMRKSKPAEFGKRISEKLKGVPKTENHINNMKAAFSEYYSNNNNWASGKLNRWNTTQLENNRTNQPTVRKVDQYDLNGNLIKTWDSVGETNKLCSGVAHCLMGKQQTSGGYVWKYNNNNPPNKRNGGKTKKYDKKEIR